MSCYIITLLTAVLVNIIIFHGFMLLDLYSHSTRTASESCVRRNLSGHGGSPFVQFCKQRINAARIPSGCHVDTGAEAWWWDRLAFKFKMASCKHDTEQAQHDSVTLSHFCASSGQEQLLPVQ